jgi:hypothetical protein
MLPQTLRGYLVHLYTSLAIILKVAVASLKWPLNLAYYVTYVQHVIALALTLLCVRILLAVTQQGQGLKLTG